MVYSAVIKVWFCHTFFQRLLVIAQPHIEKIILKFVLRPGTKVCIQLNVWFQPRFFVKGDSAVNLSYFQTEIEILFQIFVMKNTFLFFIQVGNRFLNFIDFNPLWSEWIFIVQIMKLLWILQVNFKNTSSPFLIRKFSPIFQICHPLETFHMQRQTHRPTIEIVSVRILDEF